jgi:hypothetical protein
MDRPAPDPAKLLEAWMEWERGDVTPGRVMATLKTGGLRDLLETAAAGEAQASGRSDESPAAAGEAHVSSRSEESPAADGEAHVSSRAKESPAAAGEVQASSRPEESPAPADASADTWTPVV